MDLIINGNHMQIPEDVSTITNLIDYLKISNPVVIVEHNDNILQKDDHKNTVIQTGDRIEFIQFVGGG